MNARNLLIAILSCWLAILPAVEAQAYAHGAALASQADEDKRPLTTGLDIAGDLNFAGESYFGDDYDQKLLEMLRADPSDNFEDIRRQAVQSGIAEGVLKYIGRALLGAKLIDHALRGEWRDVLEAALAEALEEGFDWILRARYGVLAVQLCAFTTIAAIVCVPAMLFIIASAKSYSAEQIAKWLRRRYCGGRAESWLCPAEDQADQEASAPPPNEFGSSERGPTGAASNGVTGGGPSRSSGRTVVGGGTIDATAKSVVTTARGGASAQTDIGVRDSGGGRLSVSAGNVVTNARGGDTSTVIGSGTGSVSTGDVYNEGGSLTIGAKGISRDGKTCVEIYLRTCIIHTYYRRKSDPCAPGYWMQARKCLLPADTRHSLRQP